MLLDNILNSFSLSENFEQEHSYYTDQKIATNFQIQN